MLSEKKLNRLNELARKSKQTSLTDSEIKEQQSLRKEYLDNFRSEFRGHLEKIKIVDDDKNPRQIH